MPIHRISFSLIMVFVVLVSLLVQVSTGRAEDVIVTQNRTYRGKVESADINNVTIEVIQQGRRDKLTIPRSIIVKLQVQPPPSVMRGIEAYAKGNMKKAQLNLGGIMKYQGLDADWAQKGLVFFGRSSLINGDYENAEKAYASFLKAYPDHPLAVAAKVGMAEIKRSKKNYDDALKQFRELAEPYDNKLRPSKDLLPYAAQIYMGIGKCLEDKADLPEALNAYIHVIALYPDEMLYPEALYRSSMVFIRLNQFAKAERLLSELIDGYPSTDFAKKAIKEKKEIRARQAEHEKALAEKTNP